MRKSLWPLALLSLVLFSFNGRALADSVTASSSLNWTSATFSGTVTPAPFGGTPGAPSTEAGTFYQALAPPFAVTDCVDHAIEWTPVACTLQIGPNDFVTASANSEFAAIAAASPGFSSLAIVERDGTIVVGTNGTIDISIPFTATITPNDHGNCGPSCIYFAQVAGFIFLSSPNGFFPFREAQITDDGFFNIMGRSTSNSGILNLSDTGLAPGTYQFDTQMLSDVSFVPEPSTLLLLSTGLLGLAGKLLRKRFA